MLIEGNVEVLYMSSVERIHRRLATTEIVVSNLNDSSLVSIETAWREEYYP